MDFTKYLILALMPITSYAGIWSSTYVTGQAPATFEYSGGNTTHYVNLTNGDHVAYRMQSTPVGTPIKPGASYGLASNGTAAKIASVLKMPLQNTKTLAVNMLAGISKANLASAAIAARRLAPAAIMTGVATWMIGAGLDYVAGQLGEYGATTGTTSSSTGEGYYCEQLSGNRYRPTLQQCMTSGTFDHVVRVADYAPGVPRYGIYNTINQIYWARAYKATIQCSAGTTFNDATGTCAGTGAFVPLSDAAAEQKLASAPQTPSGDTASSNDQIIKDTTTNGAAPLPSLPVLSGPTTPIEIDKTQTVNSNGTRTETIKTVTPVYNNDNSVKTTQTTVTNNYDSNNVLTSSSTVTTAQPGATATEGQTDCEKYPDTIGCSQYGDVPEKDTIPTNTIDVSLTYNSVAGSCPANIVLPRGLTWDMSTVCPYVQKMRPPIVITSLLAGAFIIIGAVKT